MRQAAPRGVIAEDREGVARLEDLVSGCDQQIVATVNRDDDGSFRPWHLLDHAPGGTLREKPLHASLRLWYSRPGDGIEVAVDGFVIDLVRDNLLIEIQTRGFSSMKRKVTTLLDLGHHVRIVHPIPIDKWIVKVSDDGTILSRRRSPKHGSLPDVFAELVSFPGLLANPEPNHRPHPDQRGGVQAACT